MRKYKFVFLSLLILAAGTACVTAANSDSVLETLLIQKSGGEQLTYHIEVANTDASRHRGLMYRKQMPSDQGMLLDFKGDRYVAIWMKNTYIPLDIIFIDAAGRIVYVYPDATPLSTHTISTDQSVRAVLELNAGQLKARGIRLGDRVIFPIFNTRE